MTKTTDDSWAGLVYTVHRQLGGRASAEDVLAHAWGMAQKQQQEEWGRRGCLDSIRAILRRVDRDTHLPVAPCVGGIYVQAELLTIEEYGQLVADHHGAALREKARIERYREQCHDVYDVWLDVEDCYAKYGRAS